MSTNVKDSNIVAAPSGTGRAIAGPPLPDAPYRGIESFRFIDQRIFAAREQETWALLSNVTLYSAVLLYGESGSGKSSLINAGLLPKVLEEKYVVDRLRVQPHAGRELKVERIRKSEGPHPTYLPSNFEYSETEKICAAVAPGEVETFELSLVAFRQQLEKLRRAHGEEEEASFLPAVSSRALIIFDQFEEFITLFEEARPEGAADDGTAQDAVTLQHAILESLVKLIRDKTLPIKIVFAFREDYLAKLSLLLNRCPQLLDQSQRLLAPSLEQLPEIIRAPFTGNELRSHFLQEGGATGNGAPELSEGLAKQIAAELGVFAKGGAVNLTELQIVCLRLWQSKAPAKLFADLHVQGLLEGYGEDVVQGFAPELREPALALLKRMVTRSKTRNVVEESDLLNRTAAGGRLQPERLDRALLELVNSKLVRREARRDIHFYEIASEYLVPWITQHGAEREAARQRLKARHERQRAAKFKRMVFALVALLAGVIGLGILAAYLYESSNKAKRESLKSEQRRAAAEAGAELAKQERDRYATALTVIDGTKSDEEKLKALDQIIKWNDEGVFPSKLVVLLVGAQSTRENPQLRQAAARLLAQAASKDDLSQSLVSAAETNDSLKESLPRFFIHIPNASQMPLARKVAAALNQQGYLVPGIEIVGARATWDYELRYFRKDEEGMPAPAKILELLKQTTGVNWIDAYDPRRANSPKVRAGHFEIWFPASTGQLVISFTDEAGNALPIRKLNIRFEPLQGLGKGFTRLRPGAIAVPPGDYNVTIKAIGYQEVQRQLSINANAEVDWSNMRLREE